MTIRLLAIGKTDNKQLQYLIADYEKRLNHYVRFELEIIPDVKKGKHIPESRQKDLEAEALLKKIHPPDTVILLDDKGKQYTSVAFAAYLQKWMNAGLKQLTLVVGGPYGFSDSLESIAHERVSLSRMTFSHQMSRLILVEQLYRAFTILKKEPYHHE